MPTAPNEGRARRGLAHSTRSSSRTAGPPFIAGLLEKSPRQADAQVVMDFLLSPEGQEAFNGAGEGGSALNGLDGTLDVSRMRVLSEANTPPELIAEWGVRLREIFNRG